jgi:hypothetical protein
MSGAARSFNTVALQSQEFSKSTIVTEPRFTNVNIDKDGSIRFDFTGTIDATRQKYTGSASAESEGDIDELQGTDGKLSQ